MKTRTDFPRKTKTVEGTWIPLSDGVRLSAKIWLPEDAEEHPVPAILEYLPYRYQDGTAPRDALTHPYFAGHGYACVRVDMRGAGNSEGVLLGEYLKQEQDDALEVLDWIARQRWSTGKAGMIGISWGGFNGLQVAARRPESLKAVVSICSTDDRYADDIHFMGGTMLCDNIAWSTYMFSLNTTPPDPRLLGDAWRDVWTRRLKESGLWLEQWLENLHRNDFYKHGSICENYDDVECAVYAVGGWADGYSNAVFRLLSELKSPCKGLVGPWAHKYPHFAKPGPSIGFLQECLRWWDHWLKDVENGIMDEPALRVWMEDPAPPRTQYDYRPGRWVAETAWPSPGIGNRTYQMEEGRLLETRGTSASDLRISSPLTTGQAGGAWCPHGESPDQAADQRVEAGGSLNFDTPELSSDLECLGAPVAALELACDKPAGQIAVCLNEIHRDGSVSRISFGLLNLAHRNSHERPEPVVPDAFQKVEVRLNEIAHRFAAGSRIRVAVSTSYWPIAWPSPEKAMAILRTSGCTFRLPERKPDADDTRLKPFDSPEAAPPLRKTILREPRASWTVETDMGTGRIETRVQDDEGIAVFDDYDGWTVESTHDETYSIHPDDADSASCDIVWTEKFSRGDWEVSSRTRTAVTCTRTHFVVEADLEAWDGSEPAHQQSWRKSFERKLV